jgi:hypothetical protein
MMRVFKIIFVLSVVMAFTACNQSFSDKEKELLGETAQEVMEDMTTESSQPKVKQSNAQYAQPMCDLLTEEDVKSIFSNVNNFTSKKVKQKRPECEIAFNYGEKKYGAQPAAGAIIGGFIPRKGQTTRSYLENMMASNKNHRKLEGLGDEAYLFPGQMTVFIIMIKDNLTYRFQWNQYDKSNEQNAIKLMTLIEPKI